MPTHPRAIEVENAVVGAARTAWFGALGITLLLPLSAPAQGEGGPPQDLEAAYRRVHYDFCGTGPEFVDLLAFRDLDKEAQRTRLHDALDRCLDTEFWMGVDGRVWRMAHPKVRPLEDYSASFRDYGLFVYAHTGDRDVRLALTADFYVGVASDPSGRTLYTRLTEEEVGADAFRLPPERRAGVLTTLWLLQNQIMFSPLPRTMAAHAYREYLGLDLSLGQGLFPVEGEPVDYDRARVDAPNCAVCHSTLDPLAYPFSRYHGFTWISGSYDTERMTRFEDGPPELLDTPEAGWLLGQPVSDLVEWARVAADSDAYARKVVWDYWVMIFDREPVGAEALEAERLARELKTVHGYRVSALLHALIDTEAYLAR